MSQVARDPHRWQGLAMVDSSGEKVGRVADVYLETADDRPAWFLVSGGTFGTRKLWVPVVGVRLVDEQLHVPFSLQQIREAPSPHPDGTLGPDQELALYGHYGIATEVDRPAEYCRSVAAPGDPASADDAMTRSEEEILLRRVVRPAERVRLVKHVVVEERQLTVRLRREELRVERAPYGPGEGVGGERVGELPEVEEVAGEIVLYEERPLLGTKVVPRERVRLVKSAVTDDRTLRAEVAREQVEVEEEPLQ